MVLSWLSGAQLDSPTETCGSGLTGTPGERVTSQEVQGFKSLRLRVPFTARQLSLFSAVLSGEFGVPCRRKPSIRRADYPPAAVERPGSPRQAALMVGSCATRSREPGQARKGAAVSGVPGVPQGRPAGAGCREGDGRSTVQGGVHGHSLDFVRKRGLKQPQIANETFRPIERDGGPIFRRQDRTFFTSCRIRICGSVSGAF
jgi:hypothetical protein